jgi:hypothetical protein
LLKVLESVISHGAVRTLTINNFIYRFQVLVSFILILEITYGRITKQYRNDVYDFTTVGWIFTYWKKPARLSKVINRKNVKNLEDDNDENKLDGFGYDDRESE